MRFFVGIPLALVLLVPAAARADSGVHLKLAEGSGAQLDGKRLTAVLRAHGATDLEPVFSQPGATVGRDLERLEARSARPLKDLRLYVRLAAPEDEIDGLLADLQTLPFVATAYPEPEPAPAPVSPDFSPRQGYFALAPAGLGSASVAGIPGARGDQVDVIDIEYSWNRTHEDLSRLAPAAALIANGTPKDPYTVDHGTGTAGVLAGDDNGFGITGLVPAAGFRMVNANSLERGYQVGDAINIARQNLDPGDVILLEQQAAGPEGGYVPIEWLDEAYTAITYAVAEGITVVEAAGNGAVSLDGAAYGRPFPRGRADSGAIVVGAGAAPACGTPRTRLSFSSYGSRVDLQAWGQCVTTAGYGDLHWADGVDRFYTGDWGGTSSASAIVAGAAAAYSSAYQARHGVAPTPAQVRQALKTTGTPQDLASAGALPGQIGPMPNLAAALAPFAPQIPLSGNRVANASFEAGTTGWGAWQGTLSRVAVAGAPQGAYAAKVVRASGTSFSLDDSAGGARPTIAATTAGTTYSATGFVAAAAASSVGKTVKLVLRERTPAGATVRQSTASTTLTTAFKRLAVATEAAAAGNTIGVRVEQSAAVAGHAFYADGFAVAAGNLVANPSFEAGTTGWGAWSGTLARTPVTGAPHGGSVVKVTRAAGTSYSLDDSWGGAAPTIATTHSGTTYIGAAFVRAAGAATIGRSIRIVLRERSPAGVTVRQTTTTATLGSAFQRIAVAAEAAAPGNSLGLRLEQSGAVAGDTFNADQLTLGVA